MTGFVFIVLLVCSGWLITISDAQWHKYFSGSPSVVYAQTAYTTCDQTRTQTTVSGATTGTSATKIVSLVAGDPIYVCSFEVTGTSGTNPTFSLVTGTGTNCGSNQAVVIPAFATAANTPIIFPARLNAITPAGYELCYLDGGTTPVQSYVINYAQQ